MRTTRLAAALALGIAATACNQGDAGNVMALDANALDPAQVNLALGNEASAAPDSNMIGPAGTNAPAAEPSAATTNDVAEPVNSATEPPADTTAEQ